MLVTCHTYNIVAASNWSDHKHIACNCTMHSGTTCGRPAGHADSQRLVTNEQSERLLCVLLIILLDPGLSLKVILKFFLYFQELLVHLHLVAESVKGLHGIY